ncbi:MAG: HDOD domain-containing protein [Nitrospinales bacterium]
MAKFKLEFFRDLEGLPSPPFQILKVLDEVAKASLEDFNIVRIVQNDPAIACRILKTANAPLYGYSSKILSLQQAGGLLGPAPVKNIALTSPVLERFGIHHAKYQLDCMRLWRHISATAMIAGGLGMLIPNMQGDLCYTAGLIHDIGKIALMVHFPEVMSESIKLAVQNHMPLTQAETERIALSHADIGAAMAENWRFPDVLIKAIKNFPCENALETGDKLAGVVCLAEYLANDWGFHDGVDRNPNSLPGELLDLLGIGDKDLEQWEPALKQNAEFSAEE